MVFVKAHHKIKKHLSVRILLVTGLAIFLGIVLWNYINENLRRSRAQQAPQYSISFSQKSGEVVVNNDVTVQVIMTVTNPTVNKISGFEFDIATVQSKGQIVDITTPTGTVQDGSSIAFQKANDTSRDTAYSRKLSYLLSERSPSRLPSTATFTVRLKAVGLGQMPLAITNEQVVGTVESYAYERGAVDSGSFSVVLPPTATPTPLPTATPTPTPYVQPATSTPVPATPTPTPTRTPTPVPPTVTATPTSIPRPTISSVSCSALQSNSTGLFTVVNVQGNNFGSHQGQAKLIGDGVNASIGSWSNGAIQGELYNRSLVAGARIYFTVTTAQNLTSNGLFCIVPVPPTPTPTSVPAPAAPTVISATPGCNGRPGTAWIELKWRGPWQADAYDVADPGGTVIATGADTVNGTYIVKDPKYYGTSLIFKVRSSRSNVKSAYANFDPINQENCSIIPTATHTPTSTPIPTLRPTNTPIPPTLTSTLTPRPSATNTPVPPTATFTPRPTATNTPVPTVTGVITPTNTPAPTVIACAKKRQGDANCDGRINVVDFEQWRSEYLGASTKKADFNGDGRVNLTDFETWRAYFQ